MCVLQCFVLFFILSFVIIAVAMQRQVTGCSRITGGLTAALDGVAQSSTALGLVAVNVSLDQSLGNPEYSPINRHFDSLLFERPKKLPTII